MHGGVSTRKVDELMKALGLGGISKAEVSRICGELDPLVEAFRDASADDRVPVPLGRCALLSAPGVREVERFVGVHVVVVCGATHPIAQCTRPEAPRWHQPSAILTSILVLDSGTTIENAHPVLTLKALIGGVSRTEPVLDTRLERAVLIARTCGQRVRERQDHPMCRAIDVSNIEDAIGGGVSL